VKDSLGRPLAGSTITLQSDAGRIIGATTSDDHGLFKFKQPRAGTYSITAQSTGFRPATVLLMLPQSRQSGVEITQESCQALSFPVTASRIGAQNSLSSTGTNKYTLTEHDITNLPQGQATALNEVVLQMPGVALDQNQEIHIRGEHMGIQYQTNGIMLPLDLNTDPTFTQLLNSYLVRSVTLIDGVLPARYGYHSSGITDIRTRNGCDDTHNSVTIFGGQRDTAQGSFELGGCDGNFSYYLTGLFQQSNLGFSSAVPAPDPIHDAVTHGQSFAYLTYTPVPTMKLSLIYGMTLAFNQFPNQANQTPQYQLKHINPAAYPSSAINSGLNQQDYFGVLALNGTWGSDWDYQLAYSAHYNTQTFYPDPIGDLIYQGVASGVPVPETPHSRAASASPATTIIKPQTRDTAPPQRAAFSSRTKIASAAAHARFITPPTNISAMSSQQHPTQNIPWFKPIRIAPRSPARHCVMKKPSGVRHFVRHACFSGVIW